MERVEIGDAVLFCGSMEDVLPTLGRFDACITDPPYGIGEDGGRFRDRKGGGHRVLPKMGWDSKPPSQGAFDLVMGCAGKVIIWGGNYFTDKLPVSRGWLYWDKKMGGDFSDGELAFTNIDMALRAFAKCNKMHGKEHPTQKPVDLIRWCIGFVRPAASICDPFMGSGTTGVACALEGISFVGIERERRYFDIAARRIEEAYKQADLFVPAPTAKPVQTTLFSGEAA